MESLSMQLKVLVCGLGAALGQFFAPVLPVASLCSVMVVADVVSSVRLQGRMRRAGELPGGGKLSSARFGRAVRTLVGIYVALALAHGAGLALGEAIEMFTGGVRPLNAVGLAIFVWQLMSVLENEAGCNDAVWAAKARKYLADKTKRFTE